jgi:hypothetical protein
MKLELNIFDKNELIRAASLIGFSNKNKELEKFTVKALMDMILQKVNPQEKDIREQFIDTLNFFKVSFNETDSDSELKEKLYKHNCNKIEESLAKMSEKKKRKLAEHLENSIDKSTLEYLKKYGKRGGTAGGGILLLQGGAILLTGSNLGICLLLTSGLSTISSIIGVTFPFAAYTTAAVIGGKIIAVGGFLTNPFVAVPLLGLSAYLMYKKYKSKQYINLAGINYLIESKKMLES